jgi:integrase/recombinase XerD
MYVQKHRCLKLFEESIKSPNTKTLYLHHLNKFIEFTQVKDPSKIVSLSESKIQVMLEDYLIYLKKTLSPNTIPVAMAPLELFLTINDKNCNFKKIRKMFPAQVRKTGTKSWTTQNIQRMLASTSKKRTKFLIHLLASTGCRIGVVEELRLQHLTEMPLGCKAIQFYEGTNEEYWGFLTPEASKALDEYLDERKKRGELLESHSPLLLAGSDLSVRSLTLSKKVAQLILDRCIKNAGILRQKAGERYEIQLAHGFRKRFNTILKMNGKVNSNIAEKLMGHKNGLDGVYFTPTKEQCFEEFAKAIHDLTIDESAKLHQELKKKDQELQFYKTDVDKKIAKLELTIEAMRRSRPISDERAAELTQVILNRSN